MRDDVHWEFGVVFTSGVNETLWGMPGVHARVAHFGPCVRGPRRKACGGEPEPQVPPGFRTRGRRPHKSTRGFEPTHGKYAKTARWLLRGTVPDVFACYAARYACAGRRERPIKNGQAQEGAGQGCQG